VETASQPVAGPDPFTVSAEIFTWYSRPFFKPATTQQTIIKSFYSAQKYFPGFLVLFVDGRTSLTNSCVEPPASIGWTNFIN
jgi:hypothetical protein